MIKMTKVLNFSNDQSISNKIESHHIFSDNEQQDLENDDEIYDFLSELPKNFKKMKSLAIKQMKTLQKWCNP